MPDKDPKKVGEALENVRTQDAPELFYDPTSGFVEVVHRNERVDDKDRVPATEMAREGFFGLFD